MEESNKKWTIPVFYTVNGCEEATVVCIVTNNSFGIDKKKWQLCENLDNIQEMMDEKEKVIAVSHPLKWIKLNAGQVL